MGLISRCFMDVTNLKLNERLQQYLWSFLLYPIWPVVERVFNFLHQPERQPYHLGWLAPGRTLEDLKEHLATKHGFGNHFVAWTDSGQVLSWRKLVSFSRQYHIRVFRDGEIRGHFEVTPEASPLKHFRAKGQEDRSEELLTFLGDIITPHKHLSQLEPEQLYEQIGFRASRQATTKTYRAPLITRLVVSAVSRATD